MEKNKLKFDEIKHFKRYDEILKKLGVKIKK